MLRNTSISISSMIYGNQMFDMSRKENQKYRYKVILFLKALRSSIHKNGKEKTKGEITVILNLEFRILTMIVVK